MLESEMSLNDTGKKSEFQIIHVINTTSSHVIALYNYNRSISI